MSFSNTTTTDNVYLNVVFDYDSTSNYQTTIAEYSVNKTSPIIENCSDYYVSVVRFTIPLDNIPLFIMPIKPNQGDPDLTPMILGINYLGTDYFQNLIYIPDNNLTPPIQNDPKKQVITPYYYVYTFQTLISMINLTLRALYIAAGLPVVGATDVYPYFYYDPVTLLINLVVPSVFTTSPNYPQLYMNWDLKLFLQNFNLSFQGYPQLNGKEYVFILTDAVEYPGENLSYNIYDQAVAIPPTYFKYVQEYPSISQWTSLSKILITTAGIPIRDEFIPAKDNSGENVSLSVLTDFVPNIELIKDARSVAYYVPSAQYRLCDLISSGPLYKIDMRLLWEDKLGNFYPIHISKYQQATVKLAFIRKSLYKK